MTGAPAIFLDKDGTLVEDVPYNVHPARINLADRAAQGLRRLAGAGFRFVVVTNQSGVARGFFKEEALQAVAVRLGDLLQQAAGITLDGFYYCPHHPQGRIAAYARNCRCRKPQPGLLLDAAEELGIDLSQSWMIGDILDDVEAGRQAGCRTVLINNGHETIWKPGPFRTPHFIATDLDEAARYILAHTSTTTAQATLDARDPKTL